MKEVVCPACEEVLSEDVLFGMYSIDKNFHSRVISVDCNNCGTTLILCYELADIVTA